MKATALSDGTVASLRKVREKLEPKALRAVQREFNRQKKAALAALYENYGKSRKVAAEQVYDPDVYAREMQEAMEQIYLSALNENGDLIAPQLGADFRLDDPATREYLKDAGVKIPDISRTTLRSLRRELLAGQEAGEGVDELANRIKSLPAFGKARARMVARTELGHASNTSALALYQESGLVEAIRVYDGEEHPPCAEVNGKILTLQEARSFPTLGHPNCVRAFGAVVADEMPRQIKPVASSVPVVGADTPTKDEISGSAYKKLPGKEAAFEKERDKSYQQISSNLDKSKDWQEMVKELTGTKKYSAALGKQAVDMLDKAWWGTGSPESLALQRAVDKEFGLAAPIEHMKQQFSYNWQQAEARFGKHDAAMREYARAQYDYTQQWLREQGIEGKMYLSRGMGVDTLPDGVKAGKSYKASTANKDVEIDGQPLSSWSYNPRAALTFTAYGREHSVVMGQYVDTTKIFGVGAAGFSEGRWSEVVLLGGKSKATVVAWKDDGDTDVENITLKPLIDKLGS